MLLLTAGVLVFCRSHHRGVENDWLHHKKPLQPGHHPSLSWFWIILSIHQSSLVHMHLLICHQHTHWASSKYCHDHQMNSRQLILTDQLHPCKQYFSSASRTGRMSNQFQPSDFLSQVMLMWIYSSLFSVVNGLLGVILILMTTALLVCFCSVYLWGWSQLRLID